jgi:hypothetical protein
LNSIAIDVVGQYSEAAKHLVNAYRVGSQRAINGLGGRYEHLLESRRLPLVTEELKSAFIVSQQRLSGLVLDAITRTTDRAEEAVDQLSSRAVNGMEAFGEKTAWASEMFVVNAARTINLPAAKLSLGIANRVNSATARLSARVSTLGAAKPMARAASAAKPMARAASAVKTAAKRARRVARKA